MSWRRVEKLPSSHARFQRVNVPANINTYLVPRSASKLLCVLTARGSKGTPGARSSAFLAHSTRAPVRPFRSGQLQERRRTLPNKRPFFSPHPTFLDFIAESACGPLSIISYDNIFRGQGIAKGLLSNRVKAL